MVKVTAYWRPRTVEEALDYLERPGAMVMGGTGPAGGPPVDVEVVDLQALGLAGIERHGDSLLLLGAMATLQQVADHGAVPRAVRDGARRERPSTLRTISTVGGCVARGDFESELLAALLAHDASVKLIGPDGVHSFELPVVLADRRVIRGRIITAVVIDTSGTTGVARTARTVADRAIVSAVARRTVSGELRLAMSGVGASPLLVDDLDRLDPPGDFRGSRDYRRALAVTLSARAQEAIR